MKFSAAMTLVAATAAALINPAVSMPQQRQLVGGFRPLNGFQTEEGDVDDLRQSRRLPPPPPVPRGGRQQRLQRVPENGQNRPPLPPPPPATNGRPSRPLPPQPAQAARRPQRPPQLPPPPPAPVAAVNQRRRPPPTATAGIQRPVVPKGDSPAEQEEAAAIALPEASRRIESLPPVSAPRLFVRPEFDLFGNPIVFGLVVPENEELPDFGKRQGRPMADGKAKTPRPKAPPKTNLGPDLRPRLPVFGQPDAILRATEELRSRDVNQASIVPVGVVNAGVLPLAKSKEEKNLGFFPPFAPL